MAKRSISLPDELDVAVETCASLAGVSVSAWIAGVAARAVKIQDGLAAVAEWEAEHGAITDEELAQARAELERTLAEAGPGALRPAVR